MSLLKFFSSLFYSFPSPFTSFTSQLIIYFTPYIMNILEREKGTTANPSDSNAEKGNEEQLSPQCVDTKIVVWQDDQFQDFQTDYLNQVYPQKINKNTIAKGCQFVFHFLSSSLHYWVQLKDPEIIEQGKLSSKDWKFLQASLCQQGCQNGKNYNRWGKNFQKKEQFHKLESEEQKFTIPKGDFISQYSRGQDKFAIYRYFGNNSQFIPYKQRFQILFLFYIDGVSFVDEETEQWEYFVIFKKKGNRHYFVGVLSKYIFKLTAIRQRHRISQVFIMPAYQKQGHGKQLLDVVYSRSLQQNSCFQITTQIPSFEYQCLRDYKQLQLILQKSLLDLKKTPQKITSKDDIQIVQKDILLTKQALRKIKQLVKLPGNQIERLVYLIIYAKIYGQPENQLSLAYFQQFTRQRIIFNRSAFKSRKKVPHITFKGSTADMKQFFLEKAKEDYVRNQDEIQEILTETLDGYRRVIVKLNKNKLINFV